MLKGKLGLFAKCFLHETKFSGSTNAANFYQIAISIQNLKISSILILILPTTFTLLVEDNYSPFSSTSKKFTFCVILPYFWRFLAKNDIKSFSFPFLPIKYLCLMSIYCDRDCK